MEHFTEGQDLLDSLVFNFRAGKKPRLDAQTPREIARKPMDNASLSILVCKEPGETKHFLEQESS